MQRSSWQAQRSALIDAAMGRRKADTLVQGGKWLSVQGGNIIENIDIAIVEGRIAYIGPDAHFSIGRETKLIPTDGKFMVPELENPITMRINN